jgi:Heparinase II/III-like protein
MSRQRAQAALAVVASLGLAACGGGGDDDEKAAVPECAPPLYEAIGTAPSEDAVAAAREGSFGIRKVKLKLEPPIDWDQNPIDSASFQGKLQDLTWLDPLLAAYREGDTDALAQARDIAIDWVQSNPFANPYQAGNVRGDPKPWIDKISAERIPILAWITEAAECEDILSARQRRALRDSLETHGSYLADSDNYHETNHGLYVDQGLDLLTRIARQLPDAKEWSAKAERRFERNLRLHTAGEEGFWLEHSSGYQLAITRLVQRFLEYGSPSKELKGLRAQLLDTAGWMIEPDGKVVLFGDTNEKPPTQGELEAAAGQEGLRWLPRTGLAFVKRQDPAAYLAVFASFHSDTHKDADELSFDLFDAGTRLVSDTGLYHKDFDEYFEFQDSTRAHSVLRTELDVPIDDVNAYGSGLEARGARSGWYAILGRNPLLEQQGVDHRRLYLYRPGYALVVHDEVRSNYPHVYQRLFQLGPDVAVVKDGPALDLETPGLDGELRSTANVPEGIDLARGVREPLAGFVFDRFREKKPRYTVTYTSEAADLDATTTFGIDSAQPVNAALDPAASGPSTWAFAVRGQGGDGLGRITVGREGARLELDVPEELAG